MLDKIDENTTTIDDNSRDWQYVLHLAEDAARRAGQVMKTASGKISISSQKANARDIVTDADVACQSIIQSTIQAVFPCDVFLGEEAVAPGSVASVTALEQALQQSSTNSNNTLLWIVDPIDGTTNMYCGLPLYCCSIGLVAWNETLQQPQIMVGVIYNPVLDEMTSAVAGRGAYLNGKRIQNNHTTSTSISLQEAVVNVGFPVVQESTLEASSKAVASLSTRVRGLRMIACASQVIAWVARSCLDCYISWDLNAWDVCAGMLVIKESGGVVMDFDGNNATITSRDLIFTSARGKMELAIEVRHVLDENDCLEYDKK